MPYETANEAVAEKIILQLKDKPESLLAFAAGKTQKGLFEILRDKSAKGCISFRKAKILCLTEYCGEERYPSCQSVLENELLCGLDIPRENCIFPSKENIGEMDERISRLGGVDLCVLGIGMNGHIGYNEPTSAFISPSRKVNLAPKTIRTLKKYCTGDMTAPEQALTVGLKSICSSKTIIVMAFGEEKAETVFQLLYARDDSYVPAAFLQLLSDVSVYVDEPAASKIF